MRENPTRSSPRCKQALFAMKSVRYCSREDIVTTKWRDRSDNIDRTRKYTRQAECRGQWKITLLPS